MVELDLVQELAVQVPDVLAAVHIVVGAVGHPEHVPLHVGQVQPAVGRKALHAGQGDGGAVLAVVVVAGHHGGGVRQLHLDLAHGEVAVVVGGALALLAVHIHIDVLEAQLGLSGLGGAGVLQLNLVEAACSLLIEQGLKLLAAEAQGLPGAAVVQIQLKGGHVPGLLVLQAAHRSPVDIGHSVPLQLPAVVAEEQGGPVDIAVAVFLLALHHILQRLGRDMVLKGQVSVIGPIGGLHSGQGPDGQGAHHHTEHHEKGQGLLAHSCQHAHSPSSLCAGSCKYAAAGRTWRRSPTALASRLCVPAFQPVCPFLAGFRRIFPLLSAKKSRLVRRCTHSTTARLHFGLYFEKVYFFISLFPSGLFWAGGCFFTKKIPDKIEKDSSSLFNPVL